MFRASVWIGSRSSFRGSSAAVDVVFSSSPFVLHTLPRSSGSKWKIETKVKMFFNSICDDDGEAGKDNKIVERFYFVS